MNDTVKIGNLFSGSGSWELAGKICGAEIVFQSDVDRLPVEVERYRFPEAMQLGDVKGINGSEIPAVDILTSSSPCQGLSIAGKKDGLCDDRSTLFLESIRVTKEMIHNAGCDGTKPRFWMWENVVGALSSGQPKYSDFKTVIEEIIGIVEPSVNVPIPEKWNRAGVVDGDKWQIAWRVMDSQHFGVAQRRRRLFLVADLDGHSAAEILFERQSVHWRFEEIVELWKETSTDIGERINKASRIVCRGIRDGDRDMEAQGIRSDDGTNSEDMVNECEAFSYSLKTRGGSPIDSSGRVAGKGALIQFEKTATIGTVQDQTIITPILHGDNIEYIARKLTPTECARLQGFPDDWYGDIERKDSEEYKLWGNGIALPCIIPMMKSAIDIIKNN